ncbi:Hypothetical predicted protein [Paramuricea clavata]|uniref:Uncharacterized protein n=1 Tax=Paramuricea clavata TaxID=317549 RepID=A0A7D9K8V4_PARCT|nr:Hypothetical predicted protein [Paramuricea clavata]
MRNIEKLVRIAHSQGKNWKTELYRFLLEYRTTPHVTTGIAPADLLFNRQIRNILPDSNAMIPEGNGGNLDKTSPTTGREAVLQRDAREKNKFKDRADIRNRAKEPHFRIKGSEITAKRRGVTVTRDSSHFKRVIPYLQELDDPYSNSSEEEEDGEMAVQQQQEDPENDIASELSGEDIDNA